jgi:F-type H+-transporting ATPase subunit c
VTFGAAFGIGNIAGRAMDGIARQPEASGKIFTPMIVAAALIEGVAFFNAVSVILIVLK